MFRSSLSRLRWGTPAGDLVKGAGDLVERLRSTYDAVAKAAAAGDVSVETILKPAIAAETEYSTVRAVYEFPQNVSPDKAVRDASHEASKLLSNFDVETSMRVDLYRAFKQLDAHISSAGETLTPEQDRYVKRVLRDARRNGLHLSEKDRSRVKVCKDAISTLGLEFGKNLNEENTHLNFTVEELEGLPADLLESLPVTEDGKRSISLKYPHYYPAMRSVAVPSTRQQLEKAFNSRCKETNGPILQQLGHLRHELAQLVGYQNYAQYTTEILMSKTACAFLASLCTRLSLVAAEERRTLLALKEKECQQRGIPSDGQLHAWDFRYFLNKYEETHFNVDHQALKEFFPINKVTEGLLHIYQHLLHLRFTKVDDMDVWHPDVELYRVEDADSGVLIGHFYLDLFPRDGKYGHAACFGLQPSCILPDGSRQTAVAAMVANFSKPTAGRPSLLLHEEVETYFHEFGHVMHQLCSRTELARFHGTRVERDFVEMPSQMLENWCWEAKSLALMSGHYQTGAPIPSSMLENLLASRTAMAGLLTRRQILLATFDQVMHTQPLTDLPAIFRVLSEDIGCIPATEGTDMTASFGHLAAGYAAQYYGYLWSEVYSCDAFETRFKKDVLDAEAGMAYRKTILERGGSLDGIDMLTEFLGRAPTQDAFLRSRGLTK